MRFVKGVVDSEDIPLNLSRELLQDSAQIRKLRTVITNKFLRFLQDKAKKEERSFMEFYKDYGFFLKEGILTGTDQVIIYRKSSIRSRPLIQVYSIRGQAVGGSVQALIIGKSLTPSKIPYLDHYGLVEIKKFALEIIIFQIPLIQV